MKRLLIVVFLVFATAGPVLGGQEYQEKLLGLAIISLADFHYSHDLFNDPNFEELNPLLSKSPSDKSMLALGVGGISFCYAVDKIIDDGKLKDIFIDSVVATEKRIVEINKIKASGHRRKNTAIIVIVTFEF